MVERSGRRPRAVIFDMDGLMLDTEPIYRHAWQMSAGALGYPIDDELYKQFIGRRTADCEQILMRTLGPAFPLEKFRVDWPEHWRQRVRESGVSQKHGLSLILRRLQEMDVPVAVATSTSRLFAEYTLAAGGLRARFPNVVAGDEVTHGKPAPDIFLRAASRLEINPADCIVLEDSDAGIAAAHAAGMTAIMVPDLMEPSQETREIAYAVVSSLTEALAVIERLLVQANARKAG